MKKRVLICGAVLLLITCLFLAGCFGKQETVLTIGVYSGSYWNTPNGTCYQILDEAIAFSRRLSELNGGYSVTARDFDVGRVAFCPLLYSEYRAYHPYPWRVKKYSAFQWDCVSMPAGPSGANISELHTMMQGISSRTRHENLAWEFCKLLSIDEEAQRKLYTQSHGISPLPAVAEDPELLLQIHHDIPEGSGFSPEMIHRIMSNAVVAPKFDAYSQAMIMVENAIEEAASNQLGQSGMLIAESEINIFLNKS